MSKPQPLHDVLNTSDHLLDISSDHESFTHHPSLISAYESELQFDESTFQHETEPYHSQVGDSLQETSGENFYTQSDRGDNSQGQGGDVRVFSSSPKDRPAESLSVESEGEGEDNPYSSYQQFHRDLSTHEDSKSDLLEFELLEQENTDTATPEIDLGSLAGQMPYFAAGNDVPDYDSLKEYLRKTSLANTASADSYVCANQAPPTYEMGVSEHKSRRDKWVDNSTSDVTSISNHSKPKPGKNSPSRLPTSSSSRSRPLTPSRSRSMTPTGIPVLKKGKSQSVPRERSRVLPSPLLKRPATSSPSATRRSPGDLSGRRSVSADTSIPPSVLKRSGIPSPTFSGGSPASRRRNASASQIPTSRPVTPSSSFKSLDRQSSSEPRSDMSEATGSSRPPSRLPTRSRTTQGSQGYSASRGSVEPRKLQNNSRRPSGLPSARPSVTSATELTSQDEQSPDLDLSSGDEVDNSRNPHGTFITQPHNSLSIRNPPSSDTQPFSTQADSHEQFTSADDKSTTEPPHSPKLKTTKITTTTFDYEEIETTKTTTRVLAPFSPQRTDQPDVVKGGQSSAVKPMRSKSQTNRMSRVEQLLDRRALSEDRRDSPSQFGEAKALNDAIRMLEGKENRSPTEKSSWSPTLPDEMGDNSRPSSTWTSLAEYNGSNEEAKRTVVRADEVKSDKSSVQKKGEEMPRTGHTHLPGSVNHAHYALPTTSFLHNRRSHKKKERLEDGERESSSSEVPRRSPRGKKRHEQATPAVPPSDTSPKASETESEELVKQLQTDFDDLLSKYAMAEVTIDQLRLGAKLNLYSEPAQPQSSVVQTGTARSATTLSLPQKGQASLNSSLQSANLTMSPRQAAESAVLTTAPAESLTPSQRTLSANINHLQDQVGSFVAGVTGEGRLPNLKPEIHHQLYEALEQSQDTLHHQLAEEKRADPSFDEDNQLAGQLHQIRMSMDEHLDKLPPIEQPRPSQVLTNRYHSEDETASRAPSSLVSGNSGSTSVPKARRAGRKKSSHGSRSSYTERSSSVGEEMLTDDETVRPRSHQHPGPRAKASHGAASASSVASDHLQPSAKTRARIQGSSDSGFIGSEEGKSPNTPSDRHLTGLPTIQSQAETSGIDSPRALTPDLSESRTAEWALRHKLPREDTEPVLPQPSKRRTQSRSSRKSVRSERSGQSSLRSEALRSLQTEIEKLRDDFHSQQAMLSPDKRQTSSLPKRTFGSPVKATYQLPAGYQQTAAPVPQTGGKADVRNSDLDLSEVEGGRGYTPAPQSMQGGNSPEFYPSTEEDPRGHFSESKSRREQQPFLGKEYLEQQPLRSHQRPREPQATGGEPARSRQPLSEPQSRGRARQADNEPAFNEEEMTARGYPPSPSSRRQKAESREYRASPTERRQFQEYSPTPAYDHHRPMEHQRKGQGRPSSARSQRSFYDEPDYRSYHGNRSPMSERPYEGTADDYYRRYRGPLRRSKSFHEERGGRGYSQTMDELNTRDLNQSTLPVDSTVHTNQLHPPHLAPPTAVSTPYHTHMDQSRQPTQQTHQPMASVGQSHASIHQQPPAFQQAPPPVQQLPVQPPVYQQTPVTSLPVRQTQNQLAAASAPPTVTPTYQTCASCAGRGVLATSHQCTLCGSQVKAIQQVQLANQMSGLQLSNQTSTPVVLTNQVTPVTLTNQTSTPVMLTNQSTTPVVLTNQSAPAVLTNQNTPVVIPVSNEKKAYLTQQTSEGYLTQGVDVVDGIRTSVAVPVVESSPSSAVRYYVREYGAIASDTEPSRSRSSRRRRERSRERRDSYTTSSMDDLELSLREARRSAESLKRLSRGMREDLRDELTRSLHKQSLTSSWRF